MNQTDRVILVFNSLLNSGDTTTLDVKLKLRKDYPEEYWVQDFVSMVILDYQDVNENTIWFKDNGFYRTYYKRPGDIQNILTPSVFTYITKEGATVSHSDPEVLETLLSSMGEVVHYSQSKKSLIRIADMQENHLLNTIYKKTDGFSPKEFAEFVQSSPYIKELVSRYPV